MISRSFMRPLLCSFLFFIQVALFAQTVPFEHVYRSDADLSLMKSVLLSNGKIASVSKERKFLFPSVYVNSTNFYLTDTLGQILAIKELPYSLTVVAVKENNGMIYIVANQDNSCVQCATGYIYGSYLFILDLNGNIINTTFYNQREFTFSDVGKANGLDIFNNQLFVMADSSFVVFNALGDSIAGQFHSVGYSGIIAASTSRFLTRNNNQLFAVDASLNVLNSANFGTVFNFTRSSSDEILVWHNGLVATYDTVLNQTGVLTAVNTSFDEITEVQSVNNLIHVYGKKNGEYKLIRCDQNYMRQDSVSFGVLPDISYTHFTPLQNYFIAHGNELHKQAIDKTYYYTVNTSPDFTTDAGVVAVRLDSARADLSYPSANPPLDIYNLYQDVFVTVQNFGQTIINEIQVAAWANTNAVFGTCYQPYIYDTLQNINLQPGTSQEYYIGRLEIVQIQLPYTFSICATTDMPNSLADMNTSNNDLCLANLVYVVVEEHIDPARIRIYPNPAEGETILQIEAIDFTNAYFKLTDIRGKLLASDRISQQQTLVLLPEQPGMYVLTVNIGGKIFHQKLIRK